MHGLVVVRYGMHNLDPRANLACEIIPPGFYVKNNYPTIPVIPDWDDCLL